MSDPGHILIIDDDPDFVLIYRQLLEGRGYRVTVAPAADNAVASLEQQGATFDVVLLDQRLQGRGGPDTGLELIQRITKLAPFAKTIVVTGYAAPEAIERAFEEGVYDYMEKTGAFKALLLAKVRNALEVTAERRHAALSREETVSGLQVMWDRVRQESDKHRKGVLLEELAKLLFRATPGFEYVTTRVFNDIEEIDIVVENRSDDPLWRNDGAQYILAECKNWSKPSDRREFDAFYAKLERRYQRARTGFFIAPGGFTAGFHEARKRKKNGYLVIPVGPSDLERWIHEDDRSAVLRDLHRDAVFDET